MSYTSFDRAVELVLSLGECARMGKADIQLAFRLLPVRPEDFRAPRYVRGGKVLL